jgi:hypothetical protein
VIYDAAAAMGNQVGLVNKYGTELIGEAFKEGTVAKRSPPRPWAANLTILQSSSCRAGPIRPWLGPMLTATSS